MDGEVIKPGKMTAANWCHLIRLVALKAHQHVQCLHQGQGKFIAECKKDLTAAAMLYLVRNK